MSDEVQLIPVEQIFVVNPRYRDPKKFAIIVQNIKNVGLKVPIQVSRRPASETDSFKYDLICGQGRMEAFKALGHKEIPAEVKELSRQELLICSLVENIARRYPKPMDLIREIERLKTLGNNVHQISKKLDVSDALVRGYLSLKNAGEERLAGAREYHTHSSHTGDLWDSYKRRGGYDLGGIMTQLWHVWKKCTP